MTIKCQYNCCIYNIEDIDECEHKKCVWSADYLEMLHNVTARSKPKEEPAPFKGPKNLLVEVYTDKWQPRYYTGKLNAVYSSGRTSETRTDDIVEVEKIRYTNSPWMVWFGGEQPVADGCMVEVICRDKKRIDTTAFDLCWEHNAIYADIIAWRTRKA